MTNGHHELEYSSVFEFTSLSEGIHSIVKYILDVFLELQILTVCNLNIRVAC